MAYKRTEIPELEKAMAGGRKKFVRYGRMGMRRGFIGRIEVFLLPSSVSVV